jgi:hypothetical protein
LPGSRPEMFSGIGALPEPATGSHVVNRGTPVAPCRLQAQRARVTRRAAWEATAVARWVGEKGYESDSLLIVYFYSENRDLSLSRAGPGIRNTPRLMETPLLLSVDEFLWIGYSLSPQT